ncbi:MAG TPA: hypothetical protein DCY20_04355 [Firmicutes bacterium]|nr:hypothetical protein [Bacillota bacterium]
MNKVQKFMQGRYGVDQLSMGLLILMIVITLIGQLFNQIWLIYFSWVPLILCYMRILSKNTYKRYQENLIFIRLWNPIQYKIDNKIKHIKSLKKFRYYKCKECGQSLRVPRGRGKLEIKCPKCKYTFIKKT